MHTLYSTCVGPPKTHHKIVDTRVNVRAALPGLTTHFGSWRRRPMRLHEEERPGMSDAIRWSRLAAIAACLLLIAAAVTACGGSKGPRQN